MHLLFIVNLIFFRNELPSILFLICTLISKSLAEKIEIIEACLIKTSRFLVSFVVTVD